MPNHVINKLKITGPAKDLDALKELMQGKSVFDFEKILPMPKELLKVHSGFTKINGKEVKLWIEEEVKGEKVNIGIPPKVRVQWNRKYGADNWYDWAIKHWGTKWNCYEVKTSRPGKTKLVYDFWSAWSSPAPVIEALAARFPGLVFKVDCSGEIDQNYSYTIGEES